jgi:hypothetical protein
MYILQLLLNIITAGTETLVVSGNRLLYACVTEVCRPWAQPCFDTFHQLLITVEALWSQPVLQVGKQVVVTQSEIRAVRRVVKQLLAEMLQQCTCSCKSMQTHIVMEEHYTRCQHSMPSVLNGSTQFFWCFTLHFWHYCGPLLHEFHHQHSFPVPENSCHQLAGRYFLKPFLVCFVNVCGFTALTALCFQHWQMKCRFHHVLLIWRDWEIHCYLWRITLNKSKPFSAFCVHQWAFLEPILIKKTCDSLA